MGQQEPDKTQQGQRPSPAVGKEGAPAAIQAACLAGEQICRNALGMAADSELGMSQQYSQAARKAASIPGCIYRVTACRLTEGVIHLYLALMRAHLNTASSFGLPDVRQTLIKWSEFSRGLPRQ